MAKRARGEDIEVSPKDLVRALEGISDWVNAVKAAVMELPQDARVRVPAPVHEASVPPMGFGCPPPDPCGDDDGPLYPPRPIPKPRPRRPRR